VSHKILLAFSPGVQFSEQLPGGFRFMTAPMQPAALQGLVEPGVNRRRFGQPDLAGLLLSLGVLLRPLADRLKEFQAPFGRCRSRPLTDTGRQAVRTSRT